MRGFHHSIMGWAGGGRRGLVAMLVAAVGALPAAPATGATWTCSTIYHVEDAMRNYSGGDEIVVQPGTYYVEAQLWFDVPDLTVRGATGNRDDVVFIGGGMNTDAGPRNIMHVVADDITIQDLTVSECYWNGIQLHGEKDVDRTVIRNVKTLNIGERHIKGSKGDLTHAMHDVIIENCLMQQTKPRLPHPGHSVDPDDYIGGIDAMIAKDWIIRDNVFEGIVGAAGDGRAAIFLWQGVENALVERNVILNCARGIAMGNPYNPTGTHLVDGAIIRNNTILKGNSVALEMDHTKDVKVYNNTVYGHNASYRRTIQIDDDGGGTSTTGLDFRNNIIRGDVQDTAAGDWTAAGLEAAGNIVDNVGTRVVAGWFADVAAGDLHLTGQALEAIDAATVLAEVTGDMDGHGRGPRPDMGADELPNPGDADLNGYVDLGDLTAVARNWRAGTPSDPAEWGMGNFNGDYVVDLDDAIIVARYWTGPAPPGPTTVPEPAGVALMAAAALTLLRGRRPRAAGRAKERRCAR